MEGYMYMAEELYACRACLNTDVKLYDLHRYGLVQSFSETAGLPVMHNDGLPQFICQMCYALLRKSLSFRTKCRTAQIIIQDLRCRQYLVTTQHLRNIETAHLKSPLKLSNIQTNAFPDENSKECSVSVNITHIKEETRVDFAQHEDDVAIQDDFFNDFDAGVQNDDKADEEVKDEFGDIFVFNNELRNDNKTHNANDLIEVGDEESNFVIKHIDKAKKNKKFFYEFVLEKYVKKKGGENLDVIDSVLDEELKDEACYGLQDADKEGYRKIFYEHILKKYNKNNDIKDRVDKVVDIARMRERKSKNKRPRKSEENLANFAKNYQCEIVYMTKEEHIAEIEARKETVKFKNSLFKCEECYRGFIFEKAFQNHMAIHDPSKGSYVCDVCRIRYPTRRELMKHVGNTHNLKFVCKLCRSAARNSSQAKEHYRCHVGTKYECEHCGKIFRKYGSRVNHIRIMHGSTVCELCHTPCVGQAGLVVHKAWAHREVFKCTSCGLQFHNQDALSRHVETAPDSVCGAHVRPCTQCGENFTSEDSLKVHAVQFHSQKRPKRVRGMEKPKSRAGRKPKKDGEEKGEAKTKQTHKFMCDMCGSGGFLSEASLKYHQRIHTGEKPHQCTLCDKSFRIGEQLRAHMRTHTGDRPYKCNHCPKAFKTPSAKYTHQVVHTKIRRHRCHLCEKLFLTSTCVKTHIRTVHMKIPLKPRVRRHRAQLDERAQDMYMPNMAMDYRGDIQ